MATDVMVVLRASISDFQAKMGEARAEMDKTSSSGSTAMQKMGTLGKAALLGVGAAVVGVGAFAVEMGDRFENAHAQMENAFKNAGTSADDYKGRISQVEGQLTKYGFTNAQTESALGQLVTVTGNAGESLNLMGLAADIAKNRHIDLNSATGLLAKTMAGNITAAKRMGIEIPAEVLKIKDPTQKANDILAILEGRFKGSASAAADTFAGKIATLKAQGENLGATIGTKLIPVLERMMTTVMGVVTWLEKHRAIAETLGIVIGTVLVAAIVLYTASMVSAAIATVAATWPIIAIIAAVALVVAGIVLLATHWSQVWQDIKNWVADGVAFVKSHLLLIIGAGGPIGLIIAAIVELGTHWSSIWGTIKSAVSDAWGVLSGIFDKIKSGVQDVTKAIGGVAKFISNPVGSIAGALGFADGGEVPGSPGQPVMATVHGGEYVLPQPVVSAIKSGSPPPAGATSGLGVTTASAPASGPTITINGYNLADSHQTASEIAWALKTAPV
jgi:hypothetical protein